METYSKLSSSLIHSTVWREPDHVRLVWITMLAIADRHGIVRASVPGLADAARVNIDSTIEALKRFSGPDQWSRSKVDEGRRIREISGGWELINHGLYRGLGISDERRTQTREAVRKHRENKNKTTGKHGKHGKHPDQDQDQDQDQIKNRSDPEEEAKAADGLRLVPPAGDLQPGSDASGSKPKKRGATTGKTGSLFGPQPVLAPPIGPQKVIAWFCEAWKKSKGKEYRPTDRDAGRCRDAIKKLSPEDLAQLPEMFTRYLDDKDRFIVNNDHGMVFFFSRINSYTPGGNRSQPATVGVHRVSYGKEYEGQAGYYEGDVFHPTQEMK